MTESADRKCIWCNLSEGELRTITVIATDRLGRNPHEEPVVVHPRHVAQTRSFLQFVARHARKFVAFIVSSTIVAVGLAVLIMTVLAETPRAEEFWFPVLYGPYAILLGLVIVRFPFATPETVKWLGLKKSRLLARATGGLTAALGAWILTMPWW